MCVGEDVNVCGGECLQAYGFIHILSRTKQENTEYGNWI